MVKTNPETILLKGDALQIEALANAALSPGHLVERMSNNKLRLNTIVAGHIPLVVALEQEYLSKEITQAYAADDTVIAVRPAKGTEVLLRVPAAAAAIVIGDRLEAVSGGTVRKLASGSAIAVALQAVDNSAGATEVFIQAVII